MIEALGAALSADADQLLSTEERARIDAALQRLVSTVETTRDAAEIETAIRQLEADAEFYVERRMNSGIRKAMAGHRVDEFAKQDGPSAD